MSKLDFFNKEQEDSIVHAIQEAEKNTSGEIRVHIDDSFKGKDVMKHAISIFEMLKMSETKARNGVLFYLATQTNQFVVLGDIGINKVVPTNFWESTKEKVINKFKQGEFTEGLTEGIKEAGEQLKTYFVYQSNDVNELPDEISKR